MKARAVQFSPYLGNLKKNLDIHLKHIEDGKKDGKELIVFPELSLCGYHLKDLAQDVSLSPTHEIVREFEIKSKDIDIVIGSPWEKTKGIITNAALVFSNGKMLHVHNKVQLPNFGMFQEAMIFKPGDNFHTFQLNGMTVGILICREILFPVHAYLYYLQGVDFLIGISNSPYRNIDKDGFKTFQYWEKMGYVYSVFYHQNYLFVNRTGFEDGIGFGGGSFYAPAGAGIQRKADYFDDQLLDVDVDPDKNRRSRLGGNYLRDERPDLILKEFKRILND